MYRGMNLVRSVCRAASVALICAILPWNPAFSATSPLVNQLTPLSDGFSTPVRMARDPFGGLYVSDTRAGGVLAYDAAGKFSQKISVANPLGVAIANNGDLLVSQGTSVAVFGANGVKKSQFGTFKRATGIAVDGAGTIYVVDSLDDCVQVFSASYAATPLAAATAGKPANSFGSFGSASGQFKQPTGIRYEQSTGRLAVVDTRNGRIQFFTTSGVFQASAGSFGSGPLKFTAPQSIAFEYSSDLSKTERIYVVDAYQSSVQVLDGNGQFLRYIGSYGLGSGRLVAPGDLLFDQATPFGKQLLVTNGAGSVARFGIDAGVAGSGPALSVYSVPTITNLSSLTISGTTDGTAVTVNGTQAALTSGSWSSTLNLVSGINTIAVAASGSSGTTVKTVTVTMVPLSGGGTAVALMLDPGTPSLTNAKNGLTIAGTATAGAVVTVNGIPATVSPTGTWTATVSGLTEGANTVQIVATSGQSTARIDTVVTLDTIPPAMTIYAQQSGSSSASPLQTVTGMVSDASATSVDISVNGVVQTVLVSDGVYTAVVQLAGGANTITVTARDQAGNSGTPVTRTITYDPLAPATRVTTPDATVSATPAYQLSGTAPAGSSVTVNGVPATVTGTVWSANVTLTPGINGFDVVATHPVNGKSFTYTTVTCTPGAPAAAITSPSRDAAVATALPMISGTATPGSAVTATVNGTPVPVTTSAGTFTVTLNQALIADSANSVVVSATDASGVTSMVTRTIYYEPARPAFTVTATAPVKLSIDKGVLIVKDKNGPVRDAAGNSVSGKTILDLTNVSYDAASLNIYALSPAGLSTRDGDINGDGTVDIKDALKALRVSAKLDAPASFGEMLHGDVAPMVRFESIPDGKIDLDDVVVILNKALGLIP